MGCSTSNDVKNFSQIDASKWRGQLKVELKKAVIKKELQIFGKQDTYVKIRFGRQEQKSEVCEDGGMFPEWKKQEFNFKRTNEEDTVYVQVWNANLITADDFLGEGGFSLTKIRQGSVTGKVDQSCKLYGKGRDIGEVFFVISFELLAECKNHPEVIAVDTIGKVIVKPIKATLQRDTNWIFGIMSPICIIRLGSDSQATSANIDGAKNPKWADQLIFSRDELQRDTFQIEIQNFDDSGDNEMIGTGYMSFTSFLIPNQQVQKCIDLYYEGELAGNIQIEGEFVSDEPAKQAVVVKPEQPKNQQNNDSQPQPQQPQPQPQQPSAFPVSGNAEFRYPNGDFYKGEWLNGCRHGKGANAYRIGMNYDGEWINDMWHGYGTLKQSGTTYVGSFANGKKSGFGKINWDGKQQAYEGDWQENNYHGAGYWTFENGQKRQGQFVNGNRERWMDVQQANNFIPAGRALTQGGTLPSDDGHFVLTLAYNGQITVIDTYTKFISFSINQFNRPIRPPFFLRLEPNGILNALDATGQPYYSSGFVQGQPPFKMVMQNDGRIAIHGNDQPAWYSH